MRPSHLPSAARRLDFLSLCETPDDRGVGNFERGEVLELMANIKVHP